MSTEKESITTRLEQLGAHLQLLGERFAVIAKLEKTPIWAYFFLGISFASKWDASRIAECFGGNVQVALLPDLDPLVKAYEAMATMVATAAQPNTDPPKPIPIPEWADTELYKDQRQANGQQPDPSPATH